MAEDRVKTNKRTPVVVVMGHVDHGKTSLLDYIRKTRVAGKEAGGITQSIGAYEIEHEGQKITFIDTPGHEAFKAMRTRGATIADIAVLVVAADEGPKPQTQESVKILEESKTPYVVAITKVDSPRADVQKVQNDLMNIGVYLEGYGGSVSWQGVSSKTGEGVSELLDLILLLADVSDLTYDPEARASGFVIEAKKDNRRGIVASLILKNGTLKAGQNIVTSTTQGKIKMLEDFAGKGAKELRPSAPALVVGFEDIPSAGEEFEAAEVSLVLLEAKKNGGQVTRKEGTIPAILKADVMGSLEVLKDILSEKIKLVESSAGDITDGDVKLAIATKAVIIVFRTKFNSRSVEMFAKNNDVKVFSSDVIYELVKSIEEYIEEISEPEVAGRMEVLAIFGKKDDRQVIGGKVLEGTIKTGRKVEIRRKGMLVDDGKIINLQSGKRDVKEVETPNECGILIDSVASIKVGDELSQATIK
ncbi:MAG: translation initiation factor IF-2 [Parcubacteria group bacterium]